MAMQQNRNQKNSSIHQSQENIRPQTSASNKTRMLYKELNELTHESQESVSQNFTDPSKVLRYISNNQYQNLQQEDLRIPMSSTNKNSAQSHQLLQSPNNQPQIISKSKSSVGFDKTFPANFYTQQQINGSDGGNGAFLGMNQDVSKSMDLALLQQYQNLNTNALIQSCLTFNGESCGEDINFLSQAMQPDKIFDLPLAMVKVQKAFQQQTQNAVALKESLETVLQREQKLQQKYEQLKKDNQKLSLKAEEESVQLKQGFKMQLMQITQSVNSLQSQLDEKEMALNKLKESLNQSYLQNQDLKGQIEIQNDKLNIVENQKQLLQNQIQRKTKDFDELRQQFEYLRNAEEESSKELEKYQSKSSKEESRLKQIIDEKNMFIEIVSKELECVKQEKRIMEEQESKLVNEIKKIKFTLKEDLERKYLELLEQKKAVEKENEELKFLLSNKNSLLKDYDKKFEQQKQMQVQLEEQSNKLKKDLQQLALVSKQQMQGQRQSFEQRMKEMEEEITKSSLSRYKLELEQKQKFLKSTKKYDQQLREMRSCMAYMFQKVGVTNYPQYLNDEQDNMVNSISEISIQNKDLLKAVEYFERSINEMRSGANQVVEVQKLKTDYEQLLNAYRSELNMRRGLHNQLQELKGNIRVLCRVRPLLNHEYKGRKRSSNLKILNQHRLMINNDKGDREQNFQFDRVFEPQISQADVAEEVQQLVESALDGFNVCIMAYGQTGSGKTFTMIGDDENPGLYFSSVDEIFQKIQERRKLIEYEISVSIVEIYNEQIRDLLSKKGQQAGQLIKLRENQNGETISDQIVKPIKSRNQTLGYLKEACMNRTVGVTHYNEQSSRSHFIFTMYVTGKHKECKDIFRGRINLIDLAGSERILKSQAEGERIKEALNINQSLTTLGKVFLALQNKQSHIPYRDSKLTHYLKDSLGGESKTMLIIQVSPSLNDYGETLSTLNFGCRVSTIEKGQIRATIESPNKPYFTKRSKSVKNQGAVEYELYHKSVTPQNKFSANQSFNYN